MVVLTPSLPGPTWLLVAGAHCAICIEKAGMNHEALPTPRALIEPQIQVENPWKSGEDKGEGDGGAKRGG